MNKKTKKRISIFEKNMKQINPKKILFIKLGRKAKYETECIVKKQTIRIDYKKTNHNSCSKGDWKSVYNYFIDTLEARDFVASSHTNQIKQFYEETDKTLWITFYANKLWWCFSKQKNNVTTRQKQN